MTRVRLGFVVGALVTAAAVNGCFIGTDDFGKQCKKDLDCPQIGGYLCASTAKWPQSLCDLDAGGCQCEVKFPPDPIDGGIYIPPDSGFIDSGTPDSGPQPYVDAGQPIDYCTDIRPVIYAKCLFTCHSAQMGYPNSPKDFRLDYYQPPDGGPVNDGGIAFLPGLFEKSTRCLARISSNDMPPDQQTFPGYSMAEKATFAKWVAAGSPLGSGTCEVVAPKDGGADAGPALVLFATEIQPIFTASCALANCHNTASMTGGMNLSAGNAYNSIVNVNTSAGCNMAGSKRVLPFDFKNSMLWQKLTPDGGYCNNPMVRNAAMIFRLAQPANFAKIEAWIAQGAKQN
jgi:hypothetical protein